MEERADFNPDDVHAVQEEFAPLLGDDLILGGELPGWVRALPDSVKEMAREKIPKLSGKEQSDDIPSWAERLGVRPKVGEDSQSFARRVMDDKWGRGSWRGVPERMREFSELQKYGSRGFRIPKTIVDQYGVT